MVTEFNHEVLVSTNIHHVHKVPRKIINKIFGGESQQHGQIATLGKGNDDLSVTYLGENLEDYTRNVAGKDIKDEKGKVIEKVKTANTVIDKQDSIEIQKMDPAKVLNQNSLPQ